MDKNQALEAKFWKAIKSDKTVMVGLADSEGGHMRPLTALIEDSDNKLWFFTARDSDLVRRLKGASAPAAAAFTSQGHDLFASISGKVFMNNDRAVIDRLWNPFIAAWYEQGKDDPKLALLCFEPAEAEIWLNDYSLLAGIKMMLGADPKKDYKNKVAQVDLS